MRMKRLVLLLVFFWNLENFFDCSDGGYSPSDAAFSARGERHWTRRRFEAKCAAVAKTIFACADIHGEMPEIAAFAEVENIGVLRRLINLTGLRKWDYAPVLFESSDIRGIDVGLIYRRDCLRLTSARPHSIPGLQTRDLLVATFVSPEGDSLSVIVCHHPSKYGGAASIPKRKAAVASTLAAADSLSSAGWDEILIIGDFNDTPDSGIYDPLRDRFKCLAAPLQDKNRGSIRFEGAWEMIDQAWVGGEANACQQICEFDFLTYRDPSHPGLKPRRTYSGPRYIGGVSDHYPIVVNIIKND